MKCNCGTVLTGRQRMFCSVKCKYKAHGNNTYAHQKIRGNSRKLEIIKNLGGKCSICGYRKNVAALSLHHRDPSTKSFGLDSRALSNRTMSVILDELSKCDLVCMNCHAEIHHPDLTL